MCHRPLFWPGFGEQNNACSRVSDTIRIESRSRRPRHETTQPTKTKPKHLILPCNTGESRLLLSNRREEGARNPISSLPRSAGPTAQAIKIFTDRGRLQNVPESLHKKNNHLRKNLHLSMLKAKVHCSTALSPLTCIIWIPQTFSTSAISLASSGSTTFTATTFAF